MLSNHDITGNNSSINDLSHHSILIALWGCQWWFLYNNNNNKKEKKNTAVTKGEQINRNLNTHESFILESLPVISWFDSL